MNAFGNVFQAGRDMADIYLRKYGPNAQMEHLWFRGAYDLSVIRGEIPSGCWRLYWSVCKEHLEQARTELEHAFGRII